MSESTWHNYINIKMFICCLRCSAVSAQGPNKQLSRFCCISGAHRWRGPGSGPVHHVQYSPVVLGFSGSPRWTAMVTWPSVCLKWMWTWPGKLNRCRRSNEAPGCCSRVASHGGRRCRQQPVHSTPDWAAVRWGNQSPPLRCTSTPCFKAD